MLFKNLSLEKKRLIIALLGFGILNAVGLAFEQFWVMLIPYALLLVLLIVFSFDKIFLLVAFCVPFSVNVEDVGGGFGLNLPTEPLLAILLGFFILKLIVDGYDKKALRDAVTFVILINLIWIGFTSITSSLPIVSLKFFLARIWFVVVAYFIGLQVFRRIVNIKRFYWLFIMGFLIVIGYTIFGHSQNAFTKKSAHWVMSPFFPDHTSYGAALALIFFFPLFTALSKALHKNNPFIRGFAFLVTAILIVAIALSYTRAAWVSIAAAFGLLTLIYFKVRMKHLLAIIALGVGLVLVNFNTIQMKLEHNNQQRQNDEYKEAVQSITNVTNDDSNTERINRWLSAYRMFKEKPILGWGPGTFQFQYSSFQREKDMTLISTTSGNLGNAHSEYLGPLSESGVLGMLSIIVIFLLIVNKGLKVIYEAKNLEIRMLAICTLLGLFTYMVHGFLNNFLDQDKAGVPFWAMAAMLVALDIYHNQLKSSQAEDS
jgi:putative inorganic carbon (HCO3(-)) transporter